jgi:DNA modification methylase
MAEHYSDGSVTLHHGDALEVLRELPDASVNCCVTSPPYFGLRDYGTEGQYGLEESPAEYVETLRALFAEVRRVLADDGTLWLNLGDSYSTRQRGSDKGWDKSRLTNPGRVQKMTFASLREGRHMTFDRPYKNLLGIPWRVAFALQDDGWILRNDLIWAKPNGMPESVRDRLSCKHEHIAELCVAAGCKPGGVVLDPFSGSGTTGLAATKHGRRYVGVDLNAEYLDLSLRTRLTQPGFGWETPKEAAP